jgi:hypothetical protein
MSATNNTIVKDSTSLFRDMIDTALQSNLKKNELMVCLFLMGKLLGYGKGKDPITLSQFDYGINPEKKQRKKYPQPKINLRKDHIKIALDNFVKKGIFERKPHDRYEHEYYIADQILGDFEGIFFTPTLPKIGKNPLKQEKPPQNWGHTVLDLNSPLSLQIQPRTPVVNISLDLPYFPLSITEKESRGGCDRINKKPMPPENQWSPQWNWESEGLELPTSISSNNQRFCKNNLLKCTLQQAKDTLTVYNSMWDKGNVSNPPFLLKALAKKARTDDLVLPQGNQYTKISIAKVPSTLDDSLIAYASTYGFSSPRHQAGFGYLEYRRQLVQERETKLRALNKTQAASAEETPPPAQTQVQTREQRNIDCFNTMLDHATQTGQSVQDIAAETQQCHVLKALGVPTEVAAAPPMSIEIPALPAKKSHNALFDDMLTEAIARLD